MAVTRPIRRLLVANRGEIARRIFRTCRELGVLTVAVYSDPDRLSPYVAEADVAVALGGDTSTETYLSIDKLLDAARRAGADAVHPGYGFLSENADFARAVIDAGLVWVGPPPAAIEAMADKVTAKALVGAAGVPVLPGSTVEADDPETWRNAAEGVGYPLLVKASAGGGGKGMTRVDGREGLADAITAARRVAASSFGDPTVFLERMLERPRHVEVQVLGDTFGSVTHLYTRDCSVQRRHQKVIEEAPAPGLSDALNTRLHQAAVAAAKAVDYVGAGTVEFLVAGDECFFLEMNTRLQVEHPVTEMICDVDLVAQQLRVAAGEPLRRQQHEIEANGHAIEARLYAEDPAVGFLPSTGTLLRVRWPDDLPGIRVDGGVETGSVVSSYYDPMLAKVVAAGANRDRARRRLACALRALQIHGVRTNRDSLVAVLETETFGAGEVHTGFFEDHLDTLSAAPPAGVVRLHAIAGALALLVRRDASSTLPKVARPGWRNVPSGPAHQRFRVAGGDDQGIDVAYGPPPRSGHRMPVTVDGDEFSVDVVEIAPNYVDFEIDALRHRLDVHTVGDRHWVSDSDWQTELVEVPRFMSAGSDAAAHGPSAPVPGTVVAVDVAVGDVVSEGQTLVVVEAMKMEHRLVADIDGTVSEVRVSAGEKVDAHEVLVLIDPTEPS